MPYIEVLCDIIEDVLGWTWWIWKICCGRLANFFIV